MLMNQIAQGAIIATALGAVVLLGTSCSPVTSSMTKVPPRQVDRRVMDGDNAPTSENTIAKTYIVTRADYKKTLDSLPEGLKDIRLSEKDVEQLRAKSAAIITLPEVRGGLRVFTILEVSAPSATLAEMKMEELRASWTRLEPQRDGFLLTILDDDKESLRRDFVTENLVGVTVSYQELE